MCEGEWGEGERWCTFHLEVVGLGYVEEVVAVADLEGVRFAVFVYNRNIASVHAITLALIHYNS